MVRRQELTAYALVVGCLLVAVWLVFRPALANGWVWDDWGNLANNSRYHSLTPENIHWMFTTALQGHYQPLTWLSFALDYSIWGDRPYGYHLTNILLHSINGILFFWVSLQVLRRILGNGASRGAFVGAAVSAATFALHPMRVESVAWATERRDVLCAVFFLLAVAFYLRAVVKGTADRLHRGWYWGSVGVFSLSLLSKALGMGLPVVLIALDFYPLRRIELGRGRMLKSALVRVREKLPFFLATLGAGLAALAAQEASGALVSFRSYNGLQRLAQAAYGILFYIRGMFTSLDWYPLYERPSGLDPFEPRFVLSALFVLGVTLALIVYRKHVGGVLVAWVSYLALLAPVLGLAQAGSQLVADRYSYLACMVWAVLPGWLIEMLFSRYTRSSPLSIAGVTLMVVVVGLWAVLAHRQVAVWHDERSLWEHVVEGVPSALAYNNLGSLALQRGDAVESIELFSTALEIAPRYLRARNNLINSVLGNPAGLSTGLQGKVESVMRESLRHGTGGDYRGWYVLGRLRYRARDAQGALEDLGNAVAVGEEVADVWVLTGVIHFESGRHEQGFEAFQRATTIDPGNSQAWTGIGSCLAAMGRIEEATDAFERAISLDPKNGRAVDALRRLR